LQGSGFLAVQLPDGNIAYTRDGEFQISPSGQLVTKQGLNVLGEGGPIQLDLNNPAPISISPSGEVSHGADLKAPLRAVQFNDPNLLTSISRGFFLANNPNLKSSPAADTAFHQGYLEGANTSPTMEMAHLITSMRMYEANQRVILAQDERMGRAIA